MSKSSHSLFSPVIDIGGSKEKPVKLGVEVQTQTCDFTDLTSAKSQKEQERSRVDRKEKRYIPQNSVKSASSVSLI